MTDASLTLDRVTLRIDDATLVGPLTLRVEPGQVVTVMGPSGSGKSTLLAYVGGMLPRAFAAEGRVLLGGEDVTDQPPEMRHAGILFQDDLLFPYLCVWENVAFGLPPEVRGRRARCARAVAALEEAELGDFARSDPQTLSGGQRARVALLRTLLSRPRALLLDEPFARLDLALRTRFREFVFAAARRERLPTLLVTHDPADAEAAGGPVVRLGE